MVINDLNTKEVGNPAWVAFDDGAGDTYKANFPDVVADAAEEAIKEVAISDNTVDFISSDVADGSATSWTNVTPLTTGEALRSLFGKVSQMFNNIRYLFKLLGSTSIASIGDGTVTGALSTLNGNIGAYYEGQAPTTGVSVPSDASGDTVINDVTLANAGRYLVIGRASIPKNSNGFRTIGLSIDTALKLYQTNTAAASDSPMYMQVVWYTSITAGTTINLVARQNSGSPLAILSRVTAIRLR